MALPVSILKSILKYCNLQKYELSEEPGTYNILYVEGMDCDGFLNADEPNQFNDIRLVINYHGQQVGCWSATTEPGRWYTQNPMNRNGAARIAFGQYTAWKIGVHGNSEPHKALVQVAPVKVFRDYNKDGLRLGDKVEVGLFGINQHWGYDLPINDIGKASAGCLVGRSREGHRQFINILECDIRYQRDKDFIFSTIVIPGDKLRI